MEEGGEGVEAKLRAPLESILMIGQLLMSLFLTGGELRLEGVIETMGGAPPPPPVSTPKETGGPVKFGRLGRESLLGDLLLEAEGLLLLFLFCVDS